VSSLFDIQARAYAGDDDLLRMQELVRRAVAAHGPRVECLAGDLDWRRYRFETVEPQADIRLWEQAGTLVAFAWAYPNGDLDLVVFPRELCPALVPSMLAFCETRATERPVTAWALAGNVALTQALLDAGLARGEDGYVHLHARLETLDLEPAAAPAGYTIRSIVGASEARARAAVHRAAFGSARHTDAACAELMRRARLYRHDLDVVAVAEGGELAAFALGWLDPEVGVGELEPVGTAPEHRRRGLARAVSREALRRLRAAGARDAIIYATPDNPASLATYLGLGLREIDRNVAFRRPARSALP
jgi:mycothiol synthase